MSSPYSFLTALFAAFVAAIAMRTNVAEAAFNDNPSLSNDTLPSWKTNYQFSSLEGGRASVADMQAALASSALSKASSNAKLGMTLTDLAVQQQQEPVGVPGTKPASDGVATIVDGKVLVEIVGKNAIEGFLAEALATVSGVNVTGCFQRVCSAYVALGRLETVASLDEVEFMRPSVRSTNAGSVTSEGDVAMRSNTARATYSVDGSGLLIGVLSNSYNCLGGEKADIASKDLPQGLNDIMVLKDLGPRGCNGDDEGRAMMQIVHDVAPGARLAFRTAFLGAADFAAGIIELADAGCNVIVDDIAYQRQPFFQDGIIAQAADQAVARGIPYFTAAGNDGRQAWDAPKGFVDSGVKQDGIGTFHKFGVLSNGQPITLQRIVFPNVDFKFFFSFQWDEPFFSASGAPGCASEVDIYFFVNGKVVAQGSDFNVGKDAVEFFSFNPSDAGLIFSSTVSVGFAIALSAGPPPKFMKLFSRNDVLFEFATDSSTIFGHSNGARTAGVAAAAYTETPAFGTSPPQVESFSTPGGNPIFFSTNGARLALPEIRKQPRFTGPDGGITTFFGDGNRFTGTSAAAPHVAAVAALMLSRNKTLQPAEIFSILSNTAVDMDDPFTVGFDTGFDFGTGAGLVNAVAALEASSTNPPPTKTPTKKCGLFRAGLFCPFTFCGLFGRLIGVCKA